MSAFFVEGESSPNTLSTLADLDNWQPDWNHSDSASRVPSTRQSPNLVQNRIENIYTQSQNDVDNSSFPPNLTHTPRVPELSHSAFTSAASEYLPELPDHLPVPENGDLDANGFPIVLGPLNFVDDLFSLQPDSPTARAVDTFTPDLVQSPKGNTNLVAAGPIVHTVPVAAGPILNTLTALDGTMVPYSHVFNPYVPKHSPAQLSVASSASSSTSSSTSNALELEGVPDPSTFNQEASGSYTSDESMDLALDEPSDESSPTQLHVPFNSWDSGLDTANRLAAHVNQSVAPLQVLPAPASTQSESLSPELTGDVANSPNQPGTPEERWYQGPSSWLSEVEAHQREKVSRYEANPEAWKKSDTVPKPLQPVVEICKLEYLFMLEIEGARPAASEQDNIAALLAKSEEDLNKTTGKKTKAAAEGKPKRPMNSAFCFMFWRRAQWGQMFPAMVTGHISGWLSAEWSAMKECREHEFAYWTDLTRKYSEIFNARHSDYKYTRAPNGQGRGGRAKARKAARDGLAPYPVDFDNHVPVPLKRESTTSATPNMRKSISQPIHTMDPSINPVLQFQIIGTASTYQPSMPAYQNQYPGAAHTAMLPQQGWAQGYQANNGFTAAHPGHHITANGHANGTHPGQVSPAHHSEYEANEPQYNALGFQDDPVFHTLGFGRVPQQAQPPVGFGGGYATGPQQMILMGVAGPGPSTMAATNAAQHHTVPRRHQRYDASTLPGHPYARPQPHASGSGSSHVRAHGHHHAHGQGHHHAQGQGHHHVQGQGQLYMAQGQEYQHDSSPERMVATSSYTQ